jgi:hypothetical protein
MKKTAVLLALLVLVSALSIGTGSVKAVQTVTNTYTAWQGSVSFNTTVDVNAIKTNNTEVDVTVEITNTKYAFALYLRKDDMTYIKLIVTQDGDGADIYLDDNHWQSDSRQLAGASWGVGTHHIIFNFTGDKADVYIEGYSGVAETITLPSGFDQITQFELRQEGGADSSWYSTVNLKQIDVTEFTYYYSVVYHFTNGITGQPISGVTVKENGTVLGTVDDGGTLNFTKGTYTLTFEKDGYWSVTKTIDVQDDMSVSVEMYPSSAAFKFENFPVNISMPESTIYTLTFTLSPIDTSATYNTYLSISGLQNLTEVQKDGKVVSPESGKYYLGDISGPTQVSIKFKAGSVGQHGFTLSFESHDAIQSKTYTTTKSVTYQVEPLPFSVQMPSEWQVGQNELRISESSGQSYLITAVLKDSSGNEVWSDSHAFSPYESYTFTPKIPAEGSYTLELQWNGQTAVYDITVSPAITLKTKTLTVEQGGEGSIVLHFKNPSSDVQYYTIVVSGGFLPSEINQSISVAPQTEKDVSIAFAVPDKLTYDAYELNVAVYQGNATVFQDKVAVSISDSGGFSLLGGGSSENTWLWIGAGGFGLLLLIALARRG